MQVKDEKIDRRKTNGGHKNGGREKKFVDGEVMLSFKCSPSTAKALRNYAQNSFPKPKGGYGSLLEQLARVHFGLDNVLDFPPDDV